MKLRIVVEAQAVVAVCRLVIRHDWTVAVVTGVGRAAVAAQAGIRRLVAVESLARPVAIVRVVDIGGGNWGAQVCVGRLRFFCPVEILGQESFFPE